jgi:hypothetical protein
MSDELKNSSEAAQQAPKNPSLVSSPAVTSATTGSSGSPVVATKSPATNIALGVNRVIGSVIAPPKGVHRGSTRELEAGFFHGLLYGETDSRKTTTAANFSGPANTFFVLTRGKEQLLPIRDKGYPFVQVSSGEGLAWALQNPESAAKYVYDHPGLTADERANLLQWENNAERTLITDDLTEGANQIVDGARTTDEGKEVRDGRKVYGNANIEFREVLNSMKRKPMHTVFIALSRVKANPITNDETIGPNLSSGILDLLTAEMEFVFFLQKKNYKMLTKHHFMQYTKLNDKGKTEMFKRDIFAKSKLPLDLAIKIPPVIALEEPMDLRGLWERIKTAKTTK